MAQSRNDWAALVARASAARLGAIALALSLALSAPVRAQALSESIDSPLPDPGALSVDPDPAALIAPSTPMERVPYGAPVLDPNDANVDNLEPADADPGDPALLDVDATLRPFDWMRHWGFRHSSTDGRYTDRGVPQEYTSWLNRPYHVDWFLGPLLTDNTVDGRVAQTNDLFGGLRLGWDFDYYWGVEWRFGWSNPELLAETNATPLDGKYFVSDVDFVYYLWGDTKVRPYAQLGLGLTQVGSVRVNGAGQDATLLSMPFGVGVQFPLTHWLAGRLDITDNLAFGNDGIDTMNNFSFTAGMEVRLGARPESYWPWRSSRNIW